VRYGPGMAFVGLLIVATVWLFPTARLLLLMYRGRTWRRASATVLSNAPRSAFGTRRVRVIFNLPDGQVAKAIVGFVSETSTFDPPEPGTPLDIVYDVANPDRVEAYWGIGSGLSALVLLGAVYAVVAVILIADGRRKDAARQAVAHGTAPRS